MIAAGALGSYYYFMNHGASLQQTRTIVFTTLILSNVFLTFVSRSFTRTLYYTTAYRNNLAPWIIIISSIFLVLLQFVPPIRHLFQTTTLTLNEFLLCFAIAFVTVMWFEIYKWIRGDQEDLQR